MSDISWTGGSAQDREDVLQKYEECRIANSKCDWDALEARILSRDVTFFNMNGFTYQGHEQWIRLWQYYFHHIKSGPGPTFDARGQISNDLAVMWLHRRSTLDALTDHPDATSWPHIGKEFMTRATVVFRREAEGWRIVHAHFSIGNEGNRPGGI